MFYRKLFPKQGKLQIDFEIPGQESEQIQIENLNDTNPNPKDESRNKLNPIDANPSENDLWKRIAEPKVIIDAGKIRLIYPNYSKLEKLFKQEIPDDKIADEKLMKQFNELGFQFFQDEPLGSGGNGTVWPCVYKKDNRIRFMACKRLTFAQFGKSQSPLKVLDLIIAETYVNRIIRNDKPPNCLYAEYIHRYKSSEQKADFPLATYIFMDKADGNLRDFKRNHCDRAFDMSQNDIRKLLNHMLNGLYYLHHQAKTNSAGQRVNEAFAHLDIKPDNIMYFQSKSDQTSFIFKLGDFGISKDFPINKLTNWFPYSIFKRAKHKSGVGSLMYIAPEVAAFNYTKKSYDPFKADVYSLGLVIIETLSDRPSRRFNEEYKKYKKVFDISDDLCDVIKSMTHENPRQRASVRELINTKFIRQWKYDGHYSQMYCAMKKLANNNQEKINKIFQQEINEEERISKDTSPLCVVT